MAKLAAENSYSDEELLALAREAYAKVLAGGREVMFNGRRVTRDDLGTISDSIEFLESRISSASSSTQTKHTQARMNRP